MHPVCVESSNNLEHYFLIHAGVDPVSGALEPHGDAAMLPSRPIHVCPIQPVENGSSDSQKSRWRFAHSTFPLMRSAECSR